MAIKWSAEYETGERRVDDQHKHLFEYVNQLSGVIEDVKAGQPIPLEAVKDLLTFLDTYFNVHFTYEELCMTIRKCPMAKQNVDAHKKLMEFYGNFYQKAQDGVSLDMLETLHTALSNWLVNHICKVDMDIRNQEPPHAPEVCPTA